MKKDRDCGVPYPIYPPYQGIPMPINYPTIPTNQINNIDQQINNIEQEINNLNNRVTILENMYNSNNFTNNYSSSNYKMM